MIACGICAGTVATFGSPIGGVIFAIEVTSTYYMVGTLWKSFYCATITIITMKMLFKFPFIKPNLHTTYDLIPVDHEVFFYALLGVISAVGALMFNHVLTKLIYLRTKIKQPFIAHRWKYCLTVGFFISAISFPVIFMRLSEKRLVDQMFYNGELEELKGNFVS
jgi:H+/Cl- antiporter ClcA